MKMQYKFMMDMIAVYILLAIAMDFIINEPSNEGEFLEKYYEVRKKLDDISLIQINHS